MLRKEVEYKSYLFILKFGIQTKFAPKKEIYGGSTLNILLNLIELINEYSYL